MQNEFQSSTQVKPFGDNSKTTLFHRKKKGSEKEDYLQMLTNFDIYSHLLFIYLFFLIDHLSHFIFLSLV